MLLQIGPEFEHFLEYIIPGVMCILGWFVSGPVYRMGESFIKRCIIEFRTMGK